MQDVSVCRRHLYQMCRKDISKSMFFDDIAFCDTFYNILYIWNIFTREIRILH